MVEKVENEFQTEISDWDTDRQIDVDPNDTLIADAAAYRASQTGDVITLASDRVMAMWELLSHYLKDVPTSDVFALYEVQMHELCETVDSQIDPVASESFLMRFHEKNRRKFYLEINQAKHDIVKQFYHDIIEGINQTELAIYYPRAEGESLKGASADLIDIYRRLSEQLEQKQKEEAEALEVAYAEIDASLAQTKEWFLEQCRVAPEALFDSLYGRAKDEHQAQALQDSKERLHAFDVALNQDYMARKQIIAVESVTEIMDGIHRRLESAKAMTLRTLERAAGHFGSAIRISQVKADADDVEHGGLGTGFVLSLIDDQFEVMALESENKQEVEIEPEIEFLEVDYNNLGFVDSVVKYPTPTHFASLGNFLGYVVV